jgi:hypothetical protein
VRATSTWESTPFAAISGDDRRPEIVITTEEHSVADMAIAALAASPDIYQRGGHLVHVISDDSPLRGLLRGGPAPRISPLPLPRLRELMTEYAVWMKWKIGKDEKVLTKAHPPEWCVKAVAARARWTGIRRLEAIVEAPIIRPDGSVLDVPGYDAATGLLYMPSTDFGTIPRAPTLADAKAALDELGEVIADFPFSAPEHRSACLAGMLTPLARFAIHGPAPLFLIDANIRAAGKSLLCDVTGELTTGRPMARMAHPDNDDEFRKRITAIALAGDPLVLIDNIVGALGCASLDAALTATTWRDRILGQSATTPDLPLLASWYATANNVALQADTARRVLHIRLDSREERPEERDGFHHPNLLEWVRSERPRLVRAALTVLRAYVVAGRPALTVKPWGSFESWCGLVRAALVWAGLPDPVLTRTELTEQADTELAALRVLLESWRFVDTDGTGITAGQLLVALQVPGDRYEHLRAAVLDLVPTPADKLPSARRIGVRLHHLRGRIVNGRALQKRDGRWGAIWSVQSVEGQS